LPAGGASKVLAVMKEHEFGRDAAIIGNVGERGQGGRVVLKASIGGERVVDLPTGELVPRIC
jgi:hydrogenase expression/formation protein HypE